MKTIRLRVARGAGFVDFEVECRPGASLLDSLEELRGRRDPDLRYRHSCHHGSCGTCGALVNGVERLLCLARPDDIGGELFVLEPLRKAVRIADIAVNPAALFGSLPESAPYLRRSELEHPGGRPDGGLYSRMENCIECGLCQSACPVEKPFRGPAGLAMADRRREEYPESAAAALEYAARPDGTAACERRFACSRACPQNVQPGRRIEALRKLLG